MLLNAALMRPENKPKGGSMKKLTHDQVRKAILTAWKAGLVPNLIGPVGIGKTAIVKSLAKEIAADRPGFKLWQFLTSTVQSVDIGGYPVPPTEDHKTVRYAAPSYLPYVMGDAAIDGEHGILFCDEVDRATIETLNALTQLFHGGQIHEFKLRDGVKIICAMNGETDIGTTVLPEAIKTRLVNIYVDDTIRPDWYKTQGWDVTELLPLLSVKTTTMTEAMGSLNNRTLEFALRFVDASQKLAESPEWEHDDEVINACLSGLVGESNAEAIITHKAIPSINEIIDAPMTTRIPEISSMKIAVATKCGEAYKTTRSTIARKSITRYAMRIGEEIVRSSHGCGNLFEAMKELIAKEAKTV
jgi:hypothetical protein